VENPALLKELTSVNSIQTKETRLSSFTTFIQLFNPLGLISKMSDLSKNASRLVKNLFSGSETENMIAAGVVRTILSDVTRLYFENKRAKGKGILVFNPEDPENSKYMTVRDLEDDLSVAQEAMEDQTSEMFKRVINFIEAEHDSDLALLAMIQPNEICLHMLDPVEVNKKIDEYSHGLIL